MESWKYFSSREVKPRGWLRRQLEIQAAGLSGNLDKIWPDVRDSVWLGGDREGWERLPYWLDGFIPLAYLLEDEEMIARAKKYVDTILEGQREDGWICPCSDEARPKYDCWAVFLIAKVLTVYYECSGDARIPEVIRRVLRNLYELLRDGSIRLFDWGKSRWFEGLIAISFLYQRRPEPWLKDLAVIVKEQGTDYTEYTQLWERPLNRWRFETHIVNLVMMLKSEAVSCGILGSDYTDLAEELYSILQRYNGTVYGSFTGDECLSGLSPIQGTELCAIVEQMYACELLYAATGDSKWAERLEVLAFNALPAAFSDDMWTHQYDQMSNQMACIRFPGKPVFRTNGEDAHLFGLEPHYGCCTANFSQGWPKFAMSAFLYREDTILNGFMIPGVLRTKDVEILLETDYPFENTAKYTIRAAKPFTFRIRIPSFARALRVNGVETQARELEFAIAPGDTSIVLAFAADPCFLERPHGLRAVRWGSLVFSVPVRYEKRMLEYEKDGVQRKYPYCDYELVPTSAWGYAYCGDGLEVAYAGVAEVPFSGQKPPVTIKAKVRRIDWGLEDGYEWVCAKVPRSLEPLGEEREITLWPYGCAKLRMTELPLVDA